MGPLVTLAAVFGIVLVVGLIALQAYNRLVLLSNRCDNAFSQIEIQLRRRYDLIPNLVECVKGYLSHERDTLEAVIAARNQAVSGLSQLAQNPADPQSMQALIGNEGALTSAMGRLNFVMEDYPELKANENVAQLTEELTHTENRVAFARQAYNDLVMVFNTFRQTFPTIAFAGALGYGQDRKMLVMPDGDKIQQVPQVSLVGSR